MYAIGIDIGTTSICGILVESGSGIIRKSITKDSNAFIQTQFLWEKIQSVDVIMKQALAILDELVCQDVKCIGVTGQMHGIVYIDMNGNAVSPLYTWQDQRGDLPYQNSTYAKTFGAVTGYGNTTNFYNEVNGLVPADAVCYATIHDYFAMKLCGLYKPVIHSTDAASFGHFNIEKGEFKEAFSCKVTSGFDILGCYESIPVAVAIGDNQASFIGSVNDEKSVLVNIGTGSQISVICDRIMEGKEIEVRPFFDKKYLLVGSGLCGGRAYAMLEKFYGSIITAATGKRAENVYEVMDKMLSEINNTDIAFDNKFSGTRNNPDLRGSITNITTENFTPNDFTLGMINGVADELIEMYKNMKFKAKSLVGSGNGIRRNKYLQNVFMDKIGLEMKIPFNTEEAAFGAVIYAMVSAGIAGSLQDAQKIVRYEK